MPGVFNQVMKSEKNERVSGRVAFSRRCTHSRKNHKSTITWIIYSTLRWDLSGNGTVSNIVGVRAPSPVRSIGSQMKVRVKFQSDKRSSLAILFLSGVKSASNCIKTCHRWIAKGLGDYSALRCCCLDAFRARAQKRAGLSYLLQETRALLPPLDLLIS